MTTYTHSLERCDKAFLETHDVLPQFPLDVIKRDFFGIGILNTKTEVNLGTLWRSASILGAAFIFTIGRRYKKQASDTMASWRHIPLYHYNTFEQFLETMPYDCKLIGVELHKSSIPVSDFKHPERCVYLLGAEDHGLSEEALKACNSLVQLPGDYCMNVAVAGSIIMFDRTTKRSLTL